LQVALRFFAKTLDQARQALARNERGGMVEGHLVEQAFALFRKIVGCQVDMQHMNVHLVKRNPSGFEVMKHAYGRVVNDPVFRPVRTLHNLAY
jgi:hypothetical protein